MSADNPLVLGRCPFIVESDILSLSTDFKVTNTKLIDMALGISHGLQPQGANLLRHLTNGQSYSALSVQAQTENVQPAQLHELLGFLNIIGGLRRERKHPWRARIARARHIALRLTYPLLSWRRAATPGSIALAVVRASYPVSIACGLLVGWLAFVGLLPTWRIAYLATLGLGVFWGSLFLHELTHSVVISRYGKRPAILQTGMRLGLLHKPLPKKAEVLCSLAGPSTGLIFGCLCALVATLTNDQLLVTLCICIACFHLSSLLPWYGDGRSLIGAIQS